MTVWTEYIQTKYANPPCQPRPHRTPHHLQSRWKTSFSALAAAAEAAGEPWPSLAFSRATDPEENAPLWTKIFRLIAILESNWRWSACWDLSRVCRRNPAQRGKSLNPRQQLTVRVGTSDGGTLSLPLRSCHQCELPRCCSDSKLTSSLIDLSPSHITLS